MEEIIALFGTRYIQIIGILIAIDVLFRIIVALRRKEFAFQKLALFMKGPVLGYIFGFVVLEIVAQNFSGYGKKLVMVAFILIIVALLGSIFRNLGKLGLPLPIKKE